MTVGPTSRTRRRLRRHASVPEATVRQVKVTDRRDADADVPRCASAGDPTQDEATYRCVCGYVFGAAVSTSVACPYCGDAQAW